MEVFLTIIPYLTVDTLLGNHYKHCSIQHNRKLNISITLWHEVLYIIFMDYICLLIKCALFFHIWYNTPLNYSYNKPKIFPLCILNRCNTFGNNNSNRMNIFSSVFLNWQKSPCLHLGIPLHNELIIHSDDVNRCPIVDSLKVFEISNYSLY